MLQAVPSPSSPPARSPIASIPEIVEEIRNGRIVILVDDEDRENEGDLIFAADFVTPEKINFLAKYGRGLICMPITAEHAQRLRLPDRARGVAIVEVERASPAASLGLRSGDIIHEVNGEEIASPAALEEAASAQTRWWRFTLERDGRLLRQAMRY